MWKSGATSNVCVLENGTVGKFYTDTSFMRNEIQVLNHVRGATFVANLLSVKEEFISLEHGGVDLLAAMDHVAFCIPSVVGKLVRAVASLHEMGVAHGDLKLENILWQPSDASVRLCDFGLSHFCTQESISHKGRGSRSYACPEIHAGEQYNGFRADAWSAGVCCIALACRKFPCSLAKRGDANFELLRRSQQEKETATESLKHVDIHVSDIRAVVDALYVIDPRYRKLPRNIVSNET